MLVGSRLSAVVVVTGSVISDCFCLVSEVMGVDSLETFLLFAR